MLSGRLAAPQDVAPFFTLTGDNLAGGVNFVGMRRLGMAVDDIEDVKWAFKTIYRRGLAPAQALEALHERQHRPLVAECITFIKASKRGLTRGRPRPVRSG